MLSPFFRLGMTAPARQVAFRRATVAHLLFVAALVGALEVSPSATALVLIGQGLIAAGIVEGAVLIGWRLTQIPKSQALEFVLTSPIQPRRFLFAEALVGLARLALIQLAGLPVLLPMLFTGQIEPIDLLPMLLMPFTWGAITGIGLTVWAYETLRIRKIGEYVAFAGILIYLAIGVLAGENLRLWLQALPPALGEAIYHLFQGFHVYNPFGVMQYWMQEQREPEVAIDRMIYLQLAAMLVLTLLFVRATGRLRGHFQDRHYRPIDSRRGEETGKIGRRPLSWWAVRRVMEYSGRVNIWLAGGFGLLYAAYLIAGDHWPVWMGRLVFQIFENSGGAPALITALVVLGSVPAAFQYGLWDSSPQDRCRRLELLLLTDLDAGDYWHASLSAAWRRGRGYLIVAAILLMALGISGRATLPQIVASVSAAAILWGFSFAIGFLAFSSGLQANGLGSFLTLGLPLITFAAIRAGQSTLAALLPPGAVYVSLTATPDWRWLPGPLLIATLTLWLARKALSKCEGDLRRWYDRHQGTQVVD